MQSPKEDLNKSTRKRSKNYTAEEEMVLVELVEYHKNIIENKKSDAVIWKEKEKAWQQIQDDFVATIGFHRDWKSLREKYEILKRKARQELAELKLGGVASAKISASSAKIATILGESTTELQNHYDSDYFIGPDELSCEDVKYHHEENEINYELGNASTSQQSNGLTNLKKPRSKELVVNTKRNLEEQKIELMILLQNFYKNEDSRAQEKHEQELICLKLKNQILQLEFEEKKLKKDALDQGPNF